MHENETTSIEAMKKYNQEEAINYIYLEHKGERRINFSINSSNYSIDPNRIFTSTGRKLTLKDGGLFTDEGEKRTAQFANKLLSHLKNKSAIIAMHNNTPDNYSIQSYLPDSSEARNTTALYINPEMDPDDFIYTTDEVIYKAMVKHKVNVILQDNQKFVDDGSLSVYCGINGIRYVNIETEHGHLQKQLELMQLIHNIMANTK